MTEDRSEAVAGDDASLHGIGAQYIFTRSVQPHLPKHLSLIHISEPTRPY